MPSRRLKLFNTHGIVVRSRNLGEADRIVIIITPERGLLSCVARGARKPSSRIGGHVDLLRHVSISTSTSRSGLHPITQAETIDAYLGLRSDLDRLTLASHIAETCEFFSLETAPNPPLFQLLRDSLKYAETADKQQLGILTLWHEIRLLTISGFQPELHRCVRTGADLPPDDHWFSPAEGGFIIRRPDDSDADRDERDSRQESEFSPYSSSLPPFGLGVDHDPSLSSPLIYAPMNAIKLLRYLSAVESWEQSNRIRADQDDIKDSLRLSGALLAHVQERGKGSAQRLSDELRMTSERVR